MCPPRRSQVAYRLPVGLGNGAEDSYGVPITEKVIASKFLSIPPFPTDKLQDQGSAWKLADTCHRDSFGGVMNDAAEKQQIEG